MEHVIQFGVSIDDDAIQKRIVENAEKVITEDIKKEVMGKIFEKDRYSYGVVDKFHLSDIGERIIADAVMEHKDEIIKLAAQMVAEKVFRSKKWKDKYSEVTEE